MVARYAAFNVTWQGLEEFEDYADGRALLKELGLRSQEAGSVPASAIVERESHFVAAAPRRLDGLS